jgi:hypothetical protein
LPNALAHLGQEHLNAERETACNLVYFTSSPRESEGIAGMSDYEELFARAQARAPCPKCSRASVRTEHCEAATDHLSFGKARSWTACQFALAAVAFAASVLQACSAFSSASEVDSKADAGSLVSKASDAAADAPRGVSSRRNYRYFVFRRSDERSACRLLAFR